MSLTTGSTSGGSGPPWKLAGSILVLLVAGILMFVLTPPAEEIDEGPGEQSQVVDLQLRSEQELSNVLVGVQPGRLDAIQDRLAATDELNHWLDQFPPPADQPLTSDSEALQALLPTDVLEQILNPRYLPTDTAHLRMSLLARQTVDTITRKHPQGDLSAEAYEAELLGALFRFVMDHVVDFPVSESLTPYETLLFGRGQTRDRIWCFAELVRQMGADCVLIMPYPVVENTQVVVGVLTASGKLWMFEPNVGIPFHDPQAETSKLFPQRPVTLDQVIENPAVLGALNRPPVPQLQLPGTEYPIIADQFRKVSLQIVATPAQWAPRMAYLEFRTPAEITASFYQGLGPNRLRETGTFQRLQAADAASNVWEAKEVGLWSEPLRLEQEFEATVRNSSQSEYALLRLVSSGPQDINPQTQVLESVKDTVEDVRVEQLSGKFASALSHLLPIRNADQRVSTAENRLAADFAFYRTFECQLQLGQRAAAQQTLLSYLKGSTPSHMWTTAAVSNLARLYAEDLFAAPAEEAGNLPSPFGLMQQVPPSIRNVWLMQRWYQVLASQNKIPQQPEPVSPQPTESTPANTGATEPATTSAVPPAPPLPERLPE